MVVRPSRRWFRYSLRTMLVLVTVFCVWLGWQVQIVGARKLALEEVREGGGDFIRSSETPWKKGEPLPFWRYSMGDEEIALLLIPENYVLKVGIARAYEIEMLFPDASMRVQIPKAADEMEKYFGLKMTSWAEQIYSEWRAQRLGH